MIRQILRIPLTNSKLLIFLLFLMPFALVIATDSTQINQLQNDETLNPSKNEFETINLNSMVSKTSENLKSHDQIFSKNIDFNEEIHNQNTALKSVLKDQELDNISQVIN